MSQYQPIADRFKNICFVGLNRVEYFAENAEDSIFADSWHDVTDEQSRRNMAIFFFAPRPYEGHEVDPYIFLSETDHADESDAMIMRQALSGIPLFDLCRMHKAPPNTVNVLVVADIIFHWDANDTYIQPTSPNSWVRDLKLLLKSYPRSTERHIYTAWDPSKLKELDAHIHPAQEFPLDPTAWINMPTLQEKYSGAVLAASVALAVLSYGIHAAQESSVQSLAGQIQQVTSSTPQGQDFNAIAGAMREQQEFMSNREIFSFIVKDVANAIQKSGLKLESFDVSSANQKEPTKFVLVTIKAQAGMYQGWLQEEPVAKAILAQSVTMQAIRKPPGAKQLILEGLVDIEQVKAMLEDYEKGISSPVTISWNEEGSTS